MSVNSNSICNGLSERVTELFKHGINNIWMRASGEERYHIATVLGISMDEWKIAIALSGLFDTDGRVKTGSWNGLLKLKVEFRSFNTTDLNGIQNNCKWFRFDTLEGDLETDESLTPRTAAAEEYLDDFYERLRVGSTLKSRIFRSSEVVAFIREQRLSQTTVQVSDDNLDEEEQDEYEEEVNSEYSPRAMAFQSSEDQKQKFLERFSSVNEKWQCEAVALYLKKNGADNCFPLGTRGKQSIWWRFPVLNVASATWEKFYRRIPKTFLTSLIEKTMGLMQIGVNLFSLMFFSMNESAALEGATKEGAVLDTRLAPAQTLAMQMPTGANANNDKNVNQVK